MHLRFRLKLIVSLASFASIISACPPQQVDAIQAGNHGEHGVDGDPGSDGADGQTGANQTSIVLSDSDKRWETTFGGRGGDGGNGGNGVDGDDEGTQAVGGNGGDGGDGGSANQFWINSREESNTYAIGGDGGWGGKFGMGTAVDMDGQGGSGGRGGDATAVTSADGQIPFTIAIGGNGGGAYGFGSIGGSGGDATTRSIISGDGSIQGIRAFQYGGNGGSGFAGADGGRGASTSFGFDPEQIQMAVSRKDTARYLILNGYGGSGGNTVNGTAGFGGSASLDLNGLVDVLEPQPMNFHSTQVTLHGGYGGKGMATGNQNVSGADGATAFVNVLDGGSFNTRGNTSWSFVLRGGNGGTAFGPENSGNGGHGATASFSDSVTFDNTDGMDDGPMGFAVPRMTAAAIVQGGDGGHAHGTGLGGNGANVELDRTIKLNSDGNVRLILSATGGAGGWGHRNGSGGNAMIESVEAISPPQAEHHNSNNSRTIKAKATGGNAGEARFATNSGFGGDAWASVIETDPNNLELDVKSIGGIGNLGSSGNAFVEVIAETTRSIGERDVFRITSAKGVALAARFEGTNSRPSIGTNSRAEVSAVNETYGVSTANAVAESGWGFLQSGSADALAFAESRNGGITDAHSNSFAAGDRNPDSRNFSNSWAGAKSSTLASAFATAESVGHFSRNHAEAQADSRMGRALSISESSTSTWKHAIQIANEATFESNTLQSSTITSSSFSGFRQSEFESTNGFDSAVHVLLVPDQSTADAMVLNHSQLTDVFVNDSDAAILGVGKIGAGFSDGQDGQLIVDASVDILLELQYFHDDKNMMLGLFGVDSTGNGFSEMSLSVEYNSEMIIDEAFTTLEQALSFFDSQLFDLGALNNSEEEVSFAIDFSLTADNPMDAFEFGFVLGNADPRSQLVFGSRFSSVPEPSSAILGWLVLIGFLKRQRVTARR